MKFLFYGTHPQQTNGYARIAHRITNFLATQGIEVYYFAITNYNAILPRPIHPLITLYDCFQHNPQDPFGFQWISSVVNEIKPDVVMLYNDILVLTQVVAQLPVQKSFSLQLYIDLVYPFEHVDLVTNLINTADRLYTFSSCWTKNLIQMGAPKEKLFLLTNGIDTKYLPCKKEDIGLKSSDWIILNTNRNTHRKAIDLTISSFVSLLKLIKSKNMDCYSVKLFLNFTQENTSYDIQEIIKVQSKKYNIPLQDLLHHHIVMLPDAGKISDEKVMQLYSLCDVGLNTCFGEGLGLCNLEHGSLGKPQVVTATGALVDIFQDFPQMLVQPKARLYCPNSMDMHGGYLDICTPEDIAQKLFWFYTNQDQGKKLGEKLEVYIRKNYSWNNILQKFLVDLRSTSFK